MPKWFGGSNNGYVFEMYTVSHLAILTILILGAAWIYFFRNKIKWRTAEIGTALALLAFEIIYHIWMLINGSWELSSALPLELCNISLILTVLLLLTRKKIIYEILLFTALLGATQALITPVLHFDFPHFRFFHFFYTHLMIIWVPLYFTWVHEYRPTIWSVVKLFVFLNVLLPFVILTNKLVGGNYMFLSHKPTTASLLDILGPYPWYILSMEGLLITFSLIVWLIFRERGLKTSHVVRQHVNKRTFY